MKNEAKGSRTSYTHTQNRAEQGRQANQVLRINIKFINTTYVHEIDSLAGLLPYTFYTLNYQDKKLPTITVTDRITVIAHRKGIIKIHNCTD